MTKDEALKTLLSRVYYEPKSPSKLAWNTGKFVGTLNHDGYYLMGFQGFMFTVHIVIWVLHHGPVPAGKEIDHEDTVRSNNGITNLRLADRPQNGANRPKYSTNTSGVKGLSFHKSSGKWQGNIMHKGKIHHKKDSDPTVVMEWLLEKRAELHGNFAHN